MLISSASRSLLGAPVPQICGLRDGGDADRIKSSSNWPCSPAIIDASVMAHLRSLFSMQNVAPIPLRSPKTRRANRVLEVQCEYNVIDNVT